MSSANGFSGHRSKTGIVQCCIRFSSTAKAARLWRRTRGGAGNIGSRSGNWIARFLAARRPVATLHEAGDPGSLHDGRFLLPFGEAPRFFEIDVHAREPLAVSVVDDHAPMMVLPTPVFAEFRSFELRHGSNHELNVDVRTWRCQFQGISSRRTERTLSFGNRPHRIASVLGQALEIGRIRGKRCEAEMY